MPSLGASDVRAFIPAKELAVSKRFYAALGWETRDVGPGLALVTLSADQHFYVQDYYRAASRHPPASRTARPWSSSTIRPAC